MLHPETKRRARAVQLLYAWDLTGRPAMRTVVRQLVQADARCRAGLEDAEPLAEAVAVGVEALDREIAESAEHWRLERIGAMERDILRLGLHELHAREVPVKVAITQAVELAKRFAGPQGPAFVNGILDAVAHRAGYL